MGSRSPRSKRSASTRRRKKRSRGTGSCGGSSTRRASTSPSAAKNSRPSPSREPLVGVRPTGAPWVRQTLYYADEVRPAEDIPDLPRNVRVLPAERKMAEQLVSSMVMEFDASEFKSEYKHALQKLIKAKLAGKPLAEPEAPRKGIDLQEALKQSLARLRPAAAKARRRATG